MKIATTNRITDRQYIEKYFKIVNKKRRRVPFKFNVAQAFIERSLKEGRSKGFSRFLILKARKQGASSLILAKLLIRCLTLENRRAVVVSHESGATQRLLGRVYEYKDSLNPPPPIDTESTKEMSFPETGSKYYLGTAGSRAFGRGDDTTDLHISELDWWEHSEVLTGLLESCVEDAEVFIETTGNGFGSKFHGLWTGAKKGENEYYPIFIPWFLSEEYDRPNLVGEDFVLDDMEEKYRARYGLRLSQMAWRRNKLRLMDRPDLFPQEYPADDMEAFLSSGANVFDTGVLSEWYNMPKKFLDGVLVDKEGVIEFVEQARGWLRVFLKPKADVSYRIGSDVAEGIENEAKDRDYSTGVVKHGQTWEQVAVLQYRVDPDVHAERLNLVGRYYNVAKLCVERNGPGIATLSFLQKTHKYPSLYYSKVLDERTQRETQKFGWDQNEKTRGMLIALQKKAVREKLSRVYDQRVIMEHMSFVTNSHGKDEATAGAHDDLVIADALATMMCSLNPYYDPTTNWMAPDKQMGGTRAYNKKYISRMEEYMRQKTR